MISELIAERKKHKPGSREYNRITAQIYRLQNPGRNARNIRKSRDSREIMRGARGRPAGSANHIRPFLQFTLDGKFVGKYKTIPEALDKNEFRGGASSIWHCLKGNYKTAYGFIWRYAS